MTLSFPTAPAAGQRYPATAVAGQPQWEWQGGRWTLVAPAAAQVNELPTHAAADAHKHLAVNTAGTGVEWVSLDRVHWLPPVPDRATLNGLTGMVDGDAVIVTQSHDTFVYNGNRWRHILTLPEPQGETGPGLGDSPDANKILRVNGTGGVEWVQSVAVTEMKAPVANAAALPDEASGLNADGDIRITLDDGHMHIWHAGPPGTWNNIGPAGANPIPVYSTTNRMNVLRVNQAGTAIEWAALPPGTVVAATAPAVGADGAGWFDSTNGVLMVSSAGAWVRAVPDKPHHTIAAAAPTATDPGDDGDLWFVTA